MDTTFVALIVSAIVILLTIFLLNKFKSSKKVEKTDSDDGEGNNPIRRNRAANRERFRNRLRARNNQTTAANNDNEDVDEDIEDVKNFAANLGGTVAAPAVGDDEEVDGEDDLEPNEQWADLKKRVGTKKLAKLEAKAERKAMNEQLAREREERKEREKLEDEKRKKQDEEEKRIEKENEEREKRLREEQEKREHEEYLKLKQQFIIEEEGQEESLNEKDEQNLLEKFVEFIKKSKVVILEDLAAEFKLKTQDVINRITQVEEMGLLTGLMDDRGKYIFVSEDELKKVATFLRQRGRVSIHELAQASSELINLNPTQEISVE